VTSIREFIWFYKFYIFKDFLWCSVNLYLQLFVRGFMSYLLLCLCLHIVVSNTYYVVLFICLSLTEDFPPITHNYQVSCYWLASFWQQYSWNVSNLEAFEATGCPLIFNCRKSLPPVVCKRVHVLFTFVSLFAYSGVQHILCCVVYLFVFAPCIATDIHCGAMIDVGNYYFTIRMGITNGYVDPERV
jgi:hypothetical protein